MGELSAHDVRLSGWRLRFKTEESPTPALRATSPIKGEENYGADLIPSFRVNNKDLRTTHEKLRQGFGA